MAGASHWRTLPSLTRIRGLLFNLYTNASSPQAIKSTLDMLSKAGIIALDSSGFQLWEAETKGKEIISVPNIPVAIKGGINLHPHHLINAAIDLRPNILITLDFPILLVEDPRKRELEFLKKLGSNMYWAKETCRLNESHCKVEKVFVPIQAFNIKQIDIFLESISSAKYTGLCFPIRNYELPEIALFLLYFHKIKVKQIHVLGSTSFDVLALCAYFAEHYFEWLSVDSQSWRYCADLGQIVDHKNLKITNIGKFTPILPCDRKKTCDCVACKGRSYYEISRLDRDFQAPLLREHNHAAYTNVINSMKQAVGNWDAYQAYLRTANGNYVENAIRVLDNVRRYDRFDIKLLEEVFKAK